MNLFQLLLEPAPQVSDSRQEWQGLGALDQFTKKEMKGFKAEMARVRTLFVLLMSNEHSPARMSVQPRRPYKTGNILIYHGCTLNRLPNYLSVTDDVARLCRRRMDEDRHIDFEHLNELGGALEKKIQPHYFSYHDENHIVTSRVKQSQAPSLYRWVDLDLVG